MKATRSILTLISVTCLAITFTGCSIGKVSFNEEGPMVAYTMRTESTNEGELYTTSIEISGDGEGRMTAQPEQSRSGRKIPVIHFTVGQNTLKALQEDICSSDFMGFPEDLSSDAKSNTNVNETITVTTSNGTHQCGGKNPTDERFVDLAEEIVESVPEEAFSDFNTQMAAYFN